MQHRHTNKDNELSNAGPFYTFPVSMGLLSVYLTQALFLETAASIDMKFGE